MGENFDLVAKCPLGFSTHTLLSVYIIYTCTAFFTGIAHVYVMKSR